MGKNYTGHVYFYLLNHPICTPTGLESRVMVLVGEVVVKDKKVMGLVISLEMKSLSQKRHEGKRVHPM